MKVLVVGCGSIGKRHIENINALGHDIYAVDMDTAIFEGIRSIAKGVFTSLETALEDIKPHAAFICTYSNDHIKPAILCAKAGCHLFIEKPLSLSFEGVSELSDIVKEKNLITMVGCNMRFHPAIQYMHEILKNNPHYSKPLWAHIEFGYYLPFAKKAYKKSYMANRSMGGNMIFDVIHELDYACWFFGEPEEVICEKGILSQLEIDTEDTVDMIVKFTSGIRCNIHMDYLQHGYSRRCKVVCEGGVISWDFTQGKIGTISAKDKEWKWKDVPVELYYNQMFADETKYYFDCVNSSKETFNSIQQAQQVLQFALAAEYSSQQRQWNKVGDE